MFAQKHLHNTHLPSAIRRESRSIERAKTWARRLARSWFAGTLSTQPTSVLQDLGGVRSGEEIYGPVGKHPRPIQVVAQFVEVDSFPDEGSEETADSHPENVAQGTGGSQIHELAQVTVAEGGGFPAPDLRR